MTLPNSQHQYQLVRQAKGFSLQLREGAPIRAPGPREVLVQVRATSLNRRDVSILRGFYPIANRDTLVPLSDGAGEVVAIGTGTTRFKVGDRVAAIFFQNWMSGHPSAQTGASALGGALDGMLAQYVTLSEEGLVPIPAHLSYEDAACLPCAAVTAWHGLVSRGHLQPGEGVLRQSEFARLHQVFVVHHVEHGGDGHAVGPHRHLRQRLEACGADHRALAVQVGHVLAPGVDPDAPDAQGG